MRPRRLELSGFAAFADPVSVDLAGADLFALTGPTGSGKSSLIDAIVFALYGSVPRHGRRDVAPVVTQGLLEARVRLDFGVGERDYTAVRVVRKDARTGRANTDEARLEAGGEVLAASAPEVSVAVERLLGLTYDQFTKSVVLPQGEFARFLHDKPADRQDLLVSLLDLGIYERVGQLATARQRVAEGRLAELDVRLEGLSEVTAEAVDTAAGRRTDLEDLLSAVDAESPVIERLGEEERASRLAAEEAARRVALLDSLRVPSGFGELADELGAAREALAAARLEAERAAEAVRRAEEHLGELPTRARLEGWQENRRLLSAQEARLEELAAALTSAERTVAEAVARAEQSTTAREETRRRHLALHLRAGLVPGAPCPVCAQEVSVPPPAETAPELEEAEREAEAARAEAEAAGKRVAALEARRTEAAERVAAYRAGLVDAPRAEEVAEQIAAVAQAESSREAAARAASGAAELVSAAERHLASLAQRERTARRQLQEARDRVAPLQPPPLDLEDLAADWARLVEWAEAVRPETTTAAAAAAAEADEVRDRHRAADEGLRRRCRDSGVDPGDGPVRDAVVEALTAARAHHERLAENLRLTAELRDARERRLGEAAVAKELARHLSARNFEKWLLDEALRVLAAGANRRLAELAGGQYSLALSARLDFEVVDHFAADERRSVRTLSGGETFLVSFALALALADHMASMVTERTGHLESLFLDEGFGTLDAESLETVAAVIAEIGATGRMVGIVTHVKELAEQMPVRFEVRKGPATATVTRVEE